MISDVCCHSCSLPSVVTDNISRCNSTCSRLVLGGGLLFMISSIVLIIKYRISVHKMVDSRDVEIRF